MRPSDQSRWFSEEIEPHVPLLRAYLHAKFPALHDVDDVVQESCLQLLKTKEKRPIASAKAYLFATARNAALALFRRPAIFSDRPVTELPASGISDDSANVVEQVSTEQEIAILMAAIDSLPGRCREIFILRKLQGISQKEIAARLSLSEQTVQVQIARGAKKCADFVRRQGVIGRFSSSHE